MGHDEVIIVFLSLGTLLLAARVLGELARQLNQPAVLGELLAGILLGPTVFGRIEPEWMGWLFPKSGNPAVALESFRIVAIALFLLVAGLEVELQTIKRQGRTVVLVSLMGMILPFLMGFLSGWFIPEWAGGGGGGQRLTFALFLATALSISALPVIAKTLMELNIYQSDLGMIVVASAIVNDLAGWIVFAVILGLMGSHTGHAVGYTIVLTVGLAVLILTVGRSIVNRALPWLTAHASAAGGVLGLIASMAFFAAALTEWIGVHAVFGAFLTGVAVGDSPHMHANTRRTMHQFVSSIFAPIFFASVGLRVDFLANFDAKLVIFILVIACVCKVVGCSIGARLGGLPKRESLAVGFGMNARGAMEIVLGTLALQAGLIGERMFVALVVMALVTSMISGPMMKSLLRLKRPRRLADYIPPKAFAGWLRTNERETAIRELSRAAAEASGLSEGAVFEAAWSREQMMSTGVGNGVAVPHARLEGIERPVVAVGLSGSGIDFDAPDGEPAHFVFLLLTPKSDDGVQLELLADIARSFGHSSTRQAVMRTERHTELLAVLKGAGE